MQQSILVIRAIASELARRVYVPIAIALGIISIGIVVLMVWLITISAWWLILAIPLFILILVLIGVFIVVYVAIKKVSPLQTKPQRAEVSQFVDKMQHLSEITQTPKIVLLFRAARDVISPSSDGFIQKTIGETSSLKKDFSKLRDSFSR